MTITPADVSNAREMYQKLSHLTPAMRAGAAGNPQAGKLIALHDALDARVSHAGEIDAPVLSSALSSAGLSVADVRGKAGQCPMGHGKAELPKD
ncbi:MAG: hypothetical protein AAF658_08300 [Myxococcota bacterium]